MADHDFVWLDEQIAKLVARGMRMSRNLAFDGAASLCDDFAREVPGMEAAAQCAAAIRRMQATLNTKLADDDAAQKLVQESKAVH